MKKKLLPMMMAAALLMSFLAVPVFASGKAGDGAGSPNPYRSVEHSDNGIFAIDRNRELYVWYSDDGKTMVKRNIMSNADQVSGPFDHGQFLDWYVYVKTADGELYHLSWNN